MPGLRLVVRHYRRLMSFGVPVESIESNSGPAREDRKRVGVVVFPAVNSPLLVQYRSVSCS